MVRKSVRLQVWERGGGICGICREPVSADEMEVDHRFPRSHGGTDDLSNLQPAHGDCNRRKGIACSGYLTTQQAAERLGWNPSTLRSRLGGNGLVIHQRGSGNILIAESEIEAVERDGWKAYRQERVSQRTKALFDEMDKRRRTTGRKEQQP